MNRRETASVFSFNQQRYDQGSGRRSEHFRSNRVASFGNSRNFCATMNPRLAFSTLQLATFVLAVYSAASSSSPSSLLSKSIVGGSTELKPRPEEASTLFGVTRKKKAQEDESIYVVKRDGSKEPLEKKKVGLCKFYWLQKCLQLP